ALPISMPARDLHHLAHAHRGRDGDGLLHDAAFEALDLGNLRGLLGWGHVLVDDADAAFLRERDGEPCLGHRIHGGRQQGDVKLDRAGEAGGEADFAGEDGRVGWNEENVVEGECFLYDAHPLTLHRKTKLYRRDPSRTTRGGPRALWTRWAFDAPVICR